MSRSATTLFVLALFSFAEATSEDPSSDAGCSATVPGCLVDSDMHVMLQINSKATGQQTALPQVDKPKLQKRVAPAPPILGGCESTLCGCYGCCPGSESKRATGPGNEGCEKKMIAPAPPMLGGCESTLCGCYGCCPGSDSKRATGPGNEGCEKEMIAPAPPLQPAPIDKDCLISGATETWCEEENKCVTPSTCKSFVKQNPTACLPDAHGCIPCDGMVPCGSSCQHQSIPCREPQPAPIDKDCLMGGATETWCEEENKCVTPSTCKSFVKQNPTACLPDAHGCIPCDGMVPCGSMCQHQSIPCFDDEKTPTVGGCAGTEFGCCPEHSWHPDKPNPGPNKPKHVGCYYYDLEEVEEQKAERHIAYR